MKTDYLFDFYVNRENHTINVSRQFKAPLTSVWAAWTESEILDRWWAPEPWKSKTKSMEFSEGGHRIYAMVGPEGEKHWSFAEFKSITREKNFQFRDGFCDNQGNTITELPRSVWNVGFKGQNGSTIITIKIKHDSLSDLEKIIEMSFKEGFTKALDQLDKLLARHPER